MHAQAMKLPVSNGLRILPEQLLIHLGRPLTKLALNEAMKEMDVDGSGDVDFQVSKRASFHLSVPDAKSSLERS